MKTNKVTIYDIAEKTNFSVGTVHRALNNYCCTRTASFYNKNRCRSLLPCRWICRCYYRRFSLLRRRTWKIQRWNNYQENRMHKQHWLYKKLVPIHKIPLCRRLQRYYSFYLLYNRPSTWIIKARKRFIRKKYIICHSCKWYSWIWQCSSRWN